MMNAQVRIAVFVSGGGTNLQALLDASKVGKIPHGNIVLVLSSRPDAYALERAKQAGVDTVVVSGKEYGDTERFESKIMDALRTYAVDMIVLAGFMRILSADFIKQYENRIINVHPSLIPSFCGKGYWGLHVHEAALAYGVKVTGATVHYVNSIPDGGKILLQKAVDILPEDTPSSLQKRVMEQAEWILLPQATEMVAQKISQEK